MAERTHQNTPHRLHTVIHWCSRRTSTSAILQLSLLIVITKHASLHKSRHSASTIQNNMPFQLGFDFVSHVPVASSEHSGKTYHSPRLTKNTRAGKMHVECSLNPAKPVPHKSNTAKPNNV